MGGEPLPNNDCSTNAQACILTYLTYIHTYMKTENICRFFIKAIARDIALISCAISHASVIRVMLNDRGKEECTYATLVDCNAAQSSAPTHQ